MYGILRTKRFEKSIKRIRSSGTFKRQAIESLYESIQMLADGITLPSSYKDHPLKGEFVEYRECHIKGDLLLLYKIQKEDSLLVLADIGTHSYLNL